VKREEWIALLVGFRVRGEDPHQGDPLDDLLEALAMPLHIERVLLRASPEGTKTLYSFLTDLDPETDHTEAWRGMCLWALPRIAEDAAGDREKPATTRWTLFYRDRDYLMSCYATADIHATVSRDIEYYLRERRRRLWFRKVIRAAYRCEERSKA
jgi:hypothetical protein